jgi:hypothetical protein
MLLYYTVPKRIRVLERVPAKGKYRSKEVTLAVEKLKVSKPL